jgi:hypothetical protein
MADLASSDSAEKLAEEKEAEVRIDYKAFYGREFRIEVYSTETVGSKLTTSTAIPIVRREFSIGAK